MNTFGVDISSNDGDICIQNLIDANFVIIKLTQGTTYVNKNFDAYYYRAKQAKKNIGFYHYASTNDPIAECDFFVSKLKEKEVNGICALDIESSGVNDWEKFSIDFANRFTVLTGKTLILYTYYGALDRFTIRSSFMPLWLAGYIKNGIITDYNEYLYMKLPYNPHPFGNVVMWQFTGTYKCDNHLYDANICYNENIFTLDRYVVNYGKSDIDYMYVANDVIKGEYGTGSIRRKKLDEMGYDYKLVQNMVNQIYSVAFDVINGKYGNGETRKRKLLNLGYDYDTIQYVVNGIMKEMYL